jgi:hypothetical protein
MEPHLITFIIRARGAAAKKFTANGIDLRNRLVSKRTMQNQHIGAG